VIHPSAAATSPAPTVHVIASTSSQSDSGNLLINPDFENGYSYPEPCCNNVAVPIGWHIKWYTDTDPGSGYQFFQPEVKIDDNTQWPFCGYDCGAGNIPPRIHSGRYAVDAFKSFGSLDVSLYQQVGGIPIGAVVTGSAWLHAWVSSCNPWPRIDHVLVPQPAVSLLGPNKADGTCSGQLWPETTNRMMVGIDPYGGVDPRSASVVWNIGDPDSPAWWGPYDYYSATVPAVVVARAYTLTIFLRGLTTSEAKFDDIYFDTASLRYSFPLSLSVEQDQPWPLPTQLTLTLQAPVSLTHLNAAVIDPNDVEAPIAFLDTNGVTPTITSRWLFMPSLAGPHVFRLTADQLPAAWQWPFDVNALPYHVQQDQLLPTDGAVLSESVVITFDLYTPISLTNATALLADPVGAPQAITLTAIDYLNPTYTFEWQFAPITSGLHSLELAADEFARPWDISILVLASRIYLPIVVKTANSP
jgi:hypothetical protein